MAPKQRFSSRFFFPPWSNSTSWARASSLSSPHDHTPHSAGLLWKSNQLVAKTSTWQHTTFTRDRHSCPRLDSNPHSLQESGCRPTPSTSRPLRIGFLSDYPIWRLHFSCLTYFTCSRIKVYNRNHLLPNNFVQKNTRTHFLVNRSLISNVSFLYCKSCTYFIAHSTTGILRPFRRLTARSATPPPAFAFFLIIKITLTPRATTKLLPLSEQTGRQLHVFAPPPRFVNLLQIFHLFYVWKQAHWFTECQIKKRSQEKL